MSQQKKQGELLAFGWVRENVTNFAAIPVPIVLLMSLYYDLFLYATLSNKQIKQCLVASIGHVFRLNKRTIYDFKLSVKLLPNGYIEKDQGLVLLHLHATQIPNYIEYFGVYFDFNMEGIKQCKGFAKFTKTNQYKQQIQLIKLCDLNGLKAIHSNCLIDVKYIKYDNDSNKNDMMKPFNMKDTVNFAWNLDKELIKKFETFAYGQYITHDVDKQWALDFYPNGRMKENEGASMIALKCNMLPFGIKHIVFALQVTVISLGLDQNSEEYQDEITFNGESYYFMEYSVEPEIFSLSEHSSINAISMQWKLNIIQVTDDNNKIVNKGDWQKYGIEQ